MSRLEGIDSPDTPFAEALQRWERSLRAAGVPDRLDAETVSIDRAAGRVAAQLVRALHPCPSYRAAAMDGFAVRSEQTRQATAQQPAVLQLARDAVRVDTGAPVDADFDSVVPVERSRVNANDVLVFAPVVRGKNVRLPGDDVPPGVALGWPGSPLRPLDCAALAATGVAQIAVVKRPRLGIIPTGNEIVGAGGAPRPGAVIESNAVMISAEASALGCTPNVWPVVRDDPQAIAQSLREAVAQSDAVVLIGGSSRGGRDHGADAIGRIGTIDVRRIATRPGRPVILAHCGAVPVVNLPGYPNACHFAFCAYVAPLLRKMSGRADPAARRARLSESVQTDGTADEWHAATLLTAPGSPRAIAVPSPDFLGNLYRLAEADARVHLKGGVGQYGRHAAVQYAPLRDADSAARPLFVGPFDPLIEELAALASFRCCWTEDQDGAALDEGLADAVGIVLRGEDVRALHQRAGKGRKMLMLGVRCEGVCRRPGAQRAAAGPAPAADLAAEGFERNGPWAGAAAVAAGVRESAPCTRFIAKSFGLDFEEADGCPYVAVWQEGPGRRFPWGIALKAALSGLSDAADALGWKYIGSRNEVVS